MTQDTSSVELAFRPASSGSYKIQGASAPQAAEKVVVWVERAFRPASSGSYKIQGASAPQAAEKVVVWVERAFRPASSGSYKIQGASAPAVTRHRRALHGPYQLCYSARIHFPSRFQPAAQLREGVRPSALITSLRDPCPISRDVLFPTISREEDEGVFVSRH